MPRGPRKPRHIDAPARKDGAPRAKMVAATLDLLRRSGLSGAGINQVVGASRAPKGSLYHYFPGGKHALVVEALREAERAVGAGFAKIFGQPRPVADKVRALFESAAASAEANRFSKGCPVAAVTLDLDDGSTALQEVCGSIFDQWAGLIADGLHEIPSRERLAVAELILATLEGSLVLARARRRGEPLLRTGACLATALRGRFPAERSTKSAP